jgi:protein kinase-like protein
VTPHLESGTIVAGRYIVGAELGHGGNGSVHLAHDERLDTDIALKVLYPQLAGDATFIERFRREAQTLARLSHPNILRLFEFDEDKELQLFYLVLEHMPGGSLKERLGPNPWSVEEAIEVLRPVGQAIDYAHSRVPQVVHRDMKPSNILFNSEGWPVVGDFGVARLVSDSVEKSLTGDMVIGTPAYMAPEQVRGRAEAASDRYAVGVIAYELLVGRVPHQADTLLETLVLVSSTPPPPPRQFNPAITEPVEQVLLKALHADPAKRYGTCEEMVFALEQAARLGSDDRTVVGTRFRTPGPNLPTIGTPLPQVRPTAARRKVLGQTASVAASSVAPPADDGATAAVSPHSFASAPELTVAAPSLTRQAGVRPAAAATTGGGLAAPLGIKASTRTLMLAAGGVLSLLLVLVLVVTLTSRKPETSALSPEMQTLAGASASNTTNSVPAEVAAGTASGASAPVLFSETLSDVGKGRLPKGSPQPAKYDARYDAEGYLIAVINPTFTGIATVTVPGAAGTFDDADVLVDARITDPTSNKFIALSCRDQGSANSGYQFLAKPVSGQATLQRVDRGTPTTLTSLATPDPKLSSQDVNKFELICAGSAIRGLINGTEVAKTQDAAYPTGGLTIGAGADAGGPSTVEAHFKNLVVTHP